MMVKCNKKKSNLKSEFTQSAPKQAMRPVGIDALKQNNTFKEETSKA